MSRGACGSSIFSIRRAICSASDMICTTPMSQWSEDASFYPAALLLGLIRGGEVIHWADEVIHREPSAPAGLFELSTTSPGDLTTLRRRLFEAGGDSDSGAVVRRLLGLIQRDLATGRRG